MHRVAIIGLGRIAGLYISPDSEMPYGHAGGLRDSDKVTLGAAVDISQENRDAFRMSWGTLFPEAKYFSSVEELLAPQTAGQLPDIVSVCVRGPLHYEVMNAVLDSDVKAIFVEKPPTCSLAEMDSIVQKASIKGVPIVVSYSRHWYPVTLHMQKLIRDGIIGDVKTVVSYAPGRVLSFTSHATDLLHQFAGVRPVSVYAVGTKGTEEVPDSYEAEPYLGNIIVEFENGIHGVQVGAAGEHGTFYCDVYGSKGMARVGANVQPLILDEKRAPINLASLGFPPQRTPFAVAFDQIADYLEGGDLPHCTNDDFVTVHEMSFGAVESLFEGRKITLPNTNRTRRIYAYR
jgi:predicted dehydrogenase